MASPFEQPSPVTAACGDGSPMQVELAQQHSLPPLPSVPAPAAPAPLSARWPLRRSSSLMGGSEGGSQRMSLAEAREAMASMDALISPRRSLPPLRKLPSMPERSAVTVAGGDSSSSLPLPLQGGSPVLSPAGSARGAGRPPLPRVSSSGSSGSSGSGRSVEPSTPRTSLDDAPPRPHRRRAPGELAASEEQKWHIAWSLTAGIFTKAAAGYRTRHMAQADELATWANAWGGVAGQFMSRGRRRARSASTGSLRT